MREVIANFLRGRYVDHYLNEIFREWTGEGTKREVLTILGKAGVLCGAIQDAGEILDDPHLTAWPGRHHRPPHA